MPIPNRTLEALIRYAKHGVPTGGFLRAVLSNNLMETLAHADKENRDALHEIARYIFDELPCECWGCPESVDAWIKKHQGARHAD